MSKLYIIPTPVGNLEDITLRAIRLLGEVDFILAEDTRQTGKLLQHLSIQKRMQPFHQHNEHRDTPQVIKQIQSGMTAALVSDAGTPGISDPAYLLVKSCIDSGIDVECLPGATAFVPALVQSGFSTDKFVFEGFLPHKKGRQKRLGELVTETRTLIFYESPFRLIKLLSELESFMGGARQVAISREISKIYHETLRDTVTNLLIHFTNHPPKGEIVVVVEGYDKNKTTDTIQ